VKRILAITLPGLFFSAWLLSGCAQKDSGVGSDLAPGLNEIYPQDTTVYAWATNFLQAQATTGSSPYLYLGHDAGYDADVLLKFNPAAALPDSYLVDSLIVKLYLDSILANDGSQLPVSVALLNRSYPWFEIGVTWDNLDPQATNHYLYLDPEQYGSSIAAFQIPSAAADSDSFAFYLPSPDSLLRAWEAAGAGGKTLNFNNGLYLLSDKSQDFLVRLASAEQTQASLRPRLEIYLTAIDTSDTITTTSAWDTLLYAGGDAFIAQSSATLDSAYLYLGNAVACRSLMLFNVENLLPSYGTAVQRAEIILHADTTNSLNYDNFTSAFYLQMQDSSWMTNPDEALTQAGSPVLAVYDSESGKLTLNITTTGYAWITHSQINYGVMIKSANEYYDLSRAVFYGSGAPDSLRPQLRIVYLQGVEP